AGPRYRPGRARQPGPGPRRRTTPAAGRTRRSGHRRPAAAHPPPAGLQPRPAAAGNRPDRPERAPAAIRRQPPGRHLPVHHPPRTARLTMTALLATIGKELRLLRRDLHGLLLLFVMPVVFILIMSLALQNTFSSHHSVRIAVLSDDRAGTEASRAVLDTLHRQAGFDWHAAADAMDDSAQQAAVAADDYAFRLLLSENDDGALQADILVAPATSSAMEAVFSATVREALGRQHIRSL